MKPEDIQAGVAKALEIWGLQNLCSLAIILSFVVLALVAGRVYLEALKRNLTLRVATEVWELVIDAGTDAILFAVVLIGIFITNPDILADIKVGLPFVPLAFVLLAVALVIRLFYGGRTPATRAWYFSLALIIAACISNWFGFTFVMEAASKDYLAIHPSPGWEFLRSLRSNANPDLTMTTFLWAGPALALVFAWAVVVGAARTIGWARRRDTEAGVEE